MTSLPQGSIIIVIALLHNSVPCRIRGKPELVLLLQPLPRVPRCEGSQPCKACCLGPSPVVFWLLSLQEPCFTGAGIGSRLCRAPRQAWDTLLVFTQNEGRFEVVSNIHYFGGGGRKKYQELNSGPCIYHAGEQTLRATITCSLKQLVLL